jgi:hypothetical protein
MARYLASKMDADFGGSVIVEAARVRAANRELCGEVKPDGYADG